jgi:hypothetical protein
MSTQPKKPEVKKTLTCGLVMPISAIDGCTAEHWSDVKTILTEAVESIVEPKFTVKLVSDADDVGVIQKRIVQNIYMSDIIVCDVSGKNPNVMFELGMRLAFDRPTVIVKDDKTDYSFDTSIIEHISYPRDLRFSKIVTFKTLLAEKVQNTYRKSTEDPDHSTFLKSFGKFKVASLEESVVSPDKVVIEMLEELQAEVSSLKRRSPILSGRRGDLPFGLTIKKMEEMIEAVSEYRAKHNIVGASSKLIGDSGFCDFVQDRIVAPKHFDSREEFMKALEFIIQTRLPG